MHLRGATALVTGAAQGLGKAFSEALLSRGASVCLSDVQAQKGKVVEKELQEKYGKDKAMFIECDVKSEEQLTKTFNQAVSKFGHVDIMVNNAGIGNENRPRDMIDINLSAVVKGSQLAVDHMRKDEGGKGGIIINVASSAGLTPIYFFPVYSATKFGVVGFTRSWAGNPHIKQLGIQFACMCPAFTDTPILKMEDSCLYPDEARRIVEQIGINEVADVATAFLQLVESDNCNGDVITITKGDGIQYHRKRGKSVRPKL